MNRNTIYFLSIKLGFWTCIMVTILSSSVIGAVSPDLLDTRQNSGFEITSLNLSTGDLKVSAGKVINPVITVKNNGISSNSSGPIQFSAMLGPMDLIHENTGYQAPDVGDKREYKVAFTIPQTQPGDYQLKITVYEQKKDRTGKKSSHSLKADSFIQVMLPSPGSASRACGCS